MKKKDKKPLNMNQVEKAFSALDGFLNNIEKNKIEIEAGHKTTFQLTSESPKLRQFNSFSGQGKPQKVDDSVLISLINECIEKENIDKGFKEFSFLTKQGKIKTTTIAEYIFNTEAGEKYESDRQIRRRVKKLLPNIKNIKKEESGYFKKGH